MIASALVVVVVAAAVVVEEVVVVSSPEGTSKVFGGRRKGIPEVHVCAHTIVSKIATPEKLFFSELIRRGVIYYAGKCLPQIILLN